MKRKRYSEDWTESVMFVPTLYGHKRIQCILPVCPKGLMCAVPASRPVPCHRIQAG